MLNGNSHPRKRTRLNWREIGVLYRRELKSAFRERSIVVNSILLPICLYPFILWAAFTAITFVQGQTEGLTSRIAVAGWPADHPKLRTRFDMDRSLRLVEPADRAEESDARIKNGELDALIILAPTRSNTPTFTNNFEAKITFNESKERSVSAKDRAVSIIDLYRQDWLKREARARGLGAEEWRRFSIVTANVASGKQMGAFILGMLVPLLFVVMVAVGCFYPAVDATAGERERNTWETLMTTAAARESIVMAKYLYVVTLGGLAGSLNLLSIILTLKPVFAPLLAKAGQTLTFTIPIAGLPIVVLAAILLGGFVGAGMMIFAAFARTFKEGQAMITPFYMMVLLPVMFLQSPGLKFTLPLAFVPVANVTMMLRSAVSGEFPWLQICLTVVVSLAVIAACVRIATLILQFEDVVVGSYSGSPIKLLRERVLRRKRSATKMPTAL
jgi:sodium transport system permease protein